MNRLALIKFIDFCMQVLKNSQNKQPNLAKLALNAWLENKLALKSKNKDLLFNNIHLMSKNGNGLFYILKVFFGSLSAGHNTYNLDMF